MIFDGDEILSVQFQMIDFPWLGTHQSAVSNAQDMIIIHWRKGQLIKRGKSSCHPIAHPPHTYSLLLLKDFRPHKTSLLSGKGYSVCTRLQWERVL